MSGTDRNPAEDIARHHALLVRSLQMRLEIEGDVDQSNPVFSTGYYRFDACQTIAGWGFDDAGRVVASDLRDVINQLNQWRTQLHHWYCWNRVLETLGADERDDVLHDLVHPVLFFCMHQPASFRDLVVEFTTALLHFGKLVVEATYQDWLPAENGPKAARIKKRLDDLPMEQRQRLRSNRWSADSFGADRPREQVLPFS